MKPGSGDRMAQVAQWMATRGGTVSECARSLGEPYDTIKQCWRRVRARLGEQAR